MSKISPKTQEILDALKGDPSDRITACGYTWAFGRSNVSAAFRIALREGIIEFAYTAVTNTPVYRRTDEAKAKYPVWPSKAA